MLDGTPAMVAMELFVVVGMALDALVGKHAMLQLLLLRMLLLVLT